MPDAVVLFDGVCNLCNGFVQFIIVRDPDRHFRFGALSSGAAAHLMRGAGLKPGSADSLVLIDGGRAYIRSTAALRILRGLGFPWSMAYGLVIVPRPLRDWAYDALARRRYAWFGRRDVCMVPGPDTRGRFLDD